MRCERTILTVLLVALILSGTLSAGPTTAYEAEMVVRGWLRADPRPLGAALRGEVTAVQTFADGFGSPAYYVAYLYPTGFVVVSADDMIEPIICFAEDGTYDPDSGGPLAALVSNDLRGRMAEVGGTFSLMSVFPQVTSNENQQRWNYLLSLALIGDGGSILMGRPPIRDGDPADVRVVPMVKSKWGQTTYEDASGRRMACYNYYMPPGEPGDPDNYPCGCVATAMAQLMRYHQYPDEPIEQQEFRVEIEGVTDKRWLVRGEGPGGAYNWDAMVLKPNDGTTDEQRRAIGALCHDAGLASRMDYTPDGSGTTLRRAAEGFTDVLLYSNAIRADNDGKGFEQEDLVATINANLDARSPVILGIVSTVGAVFGHAVLCDGYGYNGSRLYHHLNMGWEGNEDCWYNLPNVENSQGGGYDVLIQCIYNIFTHETGEIASGRITDTDGEPIVDAVVVAQGEAGLDPTTATTDGRGIYGLKGLASDSDYAVTASKLGYDFELNDIRTGRSATGSTAPGNVWGVDFVGYSNAVTVTVGSGTSAWSYPMKISFPQSRTQVIYLADEIETYGYITALALNVVGPVAETMDNWTIRMKHTDLDEYGAESLDADGWTVVYRNNEIIDIAGWRTFELETPFEYNGTDNLLIDFSHNGNYYADASACEVSRPEGSRCLFASSYGEHGDPLDWSAGSSPVVSSGNRVPNVKITLCKESRVSRGDVKLTASDGNRDDHFGCSVALSGDYAIVGAYGDDNKNGSAYIFKRDTANWIEQAKLKLSAWETDGEDQFGYSVSISGDYAIVGAPFYDADKKNSGAAYIFARESGSWVRKERLVALEGQGNLLFGFSVAIDGDYAIVGAPKDMDDTSGVSLSDRYDFGSVYVYKRDGSRWLLQKKVVALPGARRSYFGRSVAMSQDRILVAGGEVDILPESFSAYIYERNGADWTQQLELSCNGRTDLLGDSISISGNYAALGAPIEDDAEIGTDCGAAYIFERSGTTWSQQARLIATDGAPSDCFGRSISISGDYAAVGAPEDDDKGIGSGSVYVFERNGSIWADVAKLTATDGSRNDHFGSAAAIDGDYVIIAADGDDDNGSNSGSVYIFRRSGSNWTP